MLMEIVMAMTDADPEYSTHLTTRKSRSAPTKREV